MREDQAISEYLSSLKEGDAIIRNAMAADNKGADAPLTPADELWSLT